MPPSETSLKELLERIRKAEGPDRNLAWAIRCAIVRDDLALQGAFELTESIDACLALMAEVLLGTGYTSWEVSAGAAGEKPCDASIYLWADKLDARAPTAPLALLDCILQALLSQDQSDA